MEDTNKVTHYTYKHKKRKLATNCLSYQPEECREDGSSGGATYMSLLANPYVLVVTGAVWFSTTAMALLEPCLPIWLMDTIKPTVSCNH